jgi:biopolymer transport protein ExbD
MGVPIDRGRKRGLAPNINVTPLVDVVLVLLIIFMVVLPDMSDSGKPVEMVKVDKADAPLADEGVLVVTIDHDEVFTLDDDDLERAAVLSALGAAYSRNSAQKVLVRGDAALSYRVVRSFFAEVQEIGFEHISLAVGVAREWSEEGQGG